MTELFPCQKHLLATQWHQRTDESNIVMCRASCPITRLGQSIEIQESDLKKYKDTFPQEISNWFIVKICDHCAYLKGGAE